MAETRAFRALRFNVPYKGNLGDLIAPPYDVISPEKANELRQRHANNAIHLILSDPSSLSTQVLEDPKRYSTAAQTLQKWCTQNVLNRDPAPSMYVVEDRFSWRGETLLRRGILLTVKLEEFGHGKVLPHEKTLAAPIQDRLRLMSATKTHTSPIYMTFDDSDKKGIRYFEDILSKNPIADFQNRDEPISHRIWQVDDNRWIDEIQNWLEPKDFLIADGHHRYSTALHYARNEGAPLEEANWMLAFVAPSPDPGVVLSAIHRIVHASISSGELLEKLSIDFVTRELPATWTQFEGSSAPLALLDPTSETMRILTPSPSALSKLDNDLQSVPSVQLNDLVLKNALGLDLETPTDQKKVTYIKHAEELKPTLEKNGGLGFWLHPLSVSQVIQIAKAGHVLPQKSTFFYPKIMSGLVFQGLTSD